jgi:multidrug resistance efflux pump
MRTKNVLVAGSLLGIAFAVAVVVESRRALPSARPLVEPPSAPLTYRRFLAGSGLVEARMENIPVGTNVSGVVMDRSVKRGDLVKAGDPLFRIDDRNLRAELAVRQANLESAEAQLARLEVAPQQGDVPTAEAQVEVSRARYLDAEVYYQRSKGMFQRQAEAPSDFDKDRYNYQALKATLAHDEADLRRLKATWTKDLAIARAAVTQARTQVESINTDLERLTVRAPSDGEILRLYVRVGQYAALAWNEPLVVLGDIKRLHVRVDLDEQDVPYYRRGARAVATLKGRPQVRFPLEFVDIEPYVIPKQSLTGSNTERVDTRVLQVIYALPDEAHRPVPVYIGEQMDVYLEASPPQGVALEADPSTVRHPFEDAPSPHSAERPTLAPRKRGSR